MTQISVEFNELSWSEQDAIVRALVRSGEFDDIIEDEENPYESAKDYLEHNYCSIVFNLERCINGGGIDIVEEE